MWAVDSAPDALDVTRANLAGLSSRHGRNVRVVEGSWFTALPVTLRERVDVVVANPPYVADHEELPSEVEAWEPAAALRAGPTGLECYEQIVPDAARWLAPGGVLVCELGARQGPPVTALAKTAGFDAIEVLPDLAGHDRVLVARRPQPVAFGTQCVVASGAGGVGGCWRCVERPGWQPRWRTASLRRRLPRSRPTRQFRATTTTTITPSIGTPTSLVNTTQPTVLGTQVSNDPLAHTGRATGGELALALALAGCGGGLLVVSRRARRLEAPPAE